MMADDVVYESFESQDGAAFDLQYRPEQNQSRPIKIALLSDDNEEYVLSLSIDDFKKAVKTALRFDEELYVKTGSTMIFDEKPRPK